MDLEVLNVYAHAHYPGKTVEGWAVLPRGRRRELLHIDDWSFDWQDEYRYQEPVRLPRGSRISMRISYDNSAGDPRNPSHPPKRVAYGWKTFEEMGDLWFQVLARDSSDREVLARDYLRKERLAQVAGLEKQLEVSPGDLGRRKDLGYLNLRAGRLPEAIRAFQLVIEGDPASVFAWHNLGLAWNLQGEASKAALAYREAIKADPSHAPSLSNLAVVVANAGRAEEAEQYLRQAIRVQPRYVEAYGNLGAILVSLARNEEAVAIYERAVKIDPDYGPVHYNLAGPYREAGELEMARCHYRGATESDYERAATLARQALNQMRAETPSKCGPRARATLHAPWRQILTKGWRVAGTTAKCYPAGALAKRSADARIVAPRRRVRRKHPESTCAKVELPAVPRLRLMVGLS